MSLSTKGMKFTVALANLGIGGLSGGIFCREGFSVTIRQTRVINGYILTKSPLPYVENQVIENGSVIFGEKVEYPSCVTKIKIAKVTRVQNDKVTDMVSIVLSLTVVSTSPKLKGAGIKGSVTHNPEMYHLMSALGVDILVNGEVIKSAASTFELFANTTKTRVVISKNEQNGFGVSDEVYSAYTAWLSANTHTDTVTLPISANLVEYAEAAGYTVVKTANDNGEIDGGYITTEFEYIRGEMVIGIEDPITELRATTSTPNMLMVLDIARTQGFINPGTVRMYDYSNVPSLKGSDIDESLTVNEQLNKLAKLYPDGCKVGNGGSYVSSLGGQVDSANCIIDFIALKQNGGSGQDAMSIAMSEILHLKVEQNKVLAAFENGLVAWTMLRDVTEQLGMAISFFQSACESYVVGGKLIKKLFKGSRDSVVLTARALTHLEDMKVFVSGETARWFNLIDGEQYILNRQPTPNYAQVELVVDDSISFGVIYMSDWTMQVSNWGDCDGDQVNITLASDITSSYARNGYNRDVVVRIALMVLANRGQFAEASEGIAPKTFNHIPTLDRDDRARCEELYCRHSGIEGTNLVGFMKAPAMKKFVWINGESGLLDVKAIAPQGEDVGAIEAFLSYNAGFVGRAYAMEHQLGILRSLAPNGKSVNGAYSVALSLYEDKSLGGYDPKAWGLWIAAKQSFVGKNTDGQRDKAILSLAIQLAKSYSLSAKEIEFLFQAGAIQSCFHSEKEGHWNALEGDWQSYVPLCKLFRGLSSGDTSLIVSEGEFEAAIALLPDNSPLKMIGECISPIYSLLSLLGKNEGEDEE